MRIFCFHFVQIFSVRLTLGDQHWEAEGTSIKKAQHSAAASALAETTLPKPTVRTPRNTGKNPGGLFPPTLFQLLMLVTVLQKSNLYFYFVVIL